MFEVVLYLQIVNSDVELDTRTIGTAETEEACDEMATEAIGDLREYLKARGMELKWSCDVAEARKS